MYYKLILYNVNLSGVVSGVLQTFLVYFKPFWCIANLSGVLQTYLVYCKPICVLQTYLVYC